MNTIQETEEHCDECSYNRNLMESLQKENNFLKKLVFGGKFGDYVFESLGDEGAKVYLMGILGNKIEILVTRYTTIRNIKQIMQEYHDVPWHRNRILQNCQELENHRSLLGLGIPANAILQYSVHPNTKLYPPLEIFTLKQREEIVKDKFIMDEHILKRNRQYQEYLREKRVKYHLNKKGNHNSRLML